MKVLIVDDDPDIAEWVAAVLRSISLEPVMARSVDQALSLLQADDIGFVMTDFLMPGRDGGELIREIRRQNLLLPVVVMSGIDSVSDAVQLMRMGADDFLAKPLTREMLTARLSQVVAKARIYEEARLFRWYVEGAEDSDGDSVITRSPAMLKVLRQLPAMARTDASALILGPSGSGKELVAKALHRLSRRSGKPFIPVNCGALPETLVESILFGHRKGAFTGADRDSVGLARTADGGTLFLDEVGDLTLAAQVKLLRFLQSKEVTPVGDPKPSRVDVRVIAATHRDLRKCIADGTFREDLYYRLDVISVTLPPLDARPEDIPVLSNHFLAKYAPDYGSPARAFTREALGVLVDRHWRGNVRELENAIQRLVVAADGPIIDEAGVRSVLEMAPPAPRPAPSLTLAVAAADAPDSELQQFQMAKKDAVDRFERTYLEDLLKRTNRMTEAAELAGIDRKGLWRLVKKHGLRPSENEVENEVEAEPPSPPSRPVLVPPLPPEQKIAG